MIVAEAAALAAIRDAYAEPITYTGAGLFDAAIRAIYSTGAAPAFQGAGATAREVTFEVARGALPERPRKGNMIVRAAAPGTTWRVNDVTERDDVDAWSLIVEEAA